MKHARLSRPGAKGYSYLSWNRPDSYWDVVVAHLPVALITGIALLLPHMVPCHLLPLKKCTFLSLTGYPCPFCGLTRSFWAIADGNWAVALHNAPLACLVYVVTALLFAWHMTALMTGLRVGSRLFVLLKSPPVVWVTATMVVLNWAYRLGLGLE
ncbi:MAG: DUF2752 domain-containing protein [Deltaproteobacteria bacterium]|nr:DUF2752 domain-containing protein [Deltaproteobacteria bacterium]